MPWHTSHLQKIKQPTHCARKLRVAAVHSATAAERLQQRGCCGGRSAAVVRSTTVAAQWQQRGGCGSGGNATAQRRWQLGGGTAGVAASAAQPKRGGGAQRNGGSAVGAARRLRRIYRHRPQMGQRTCLQTPPTCRRTRLQPWLRTEG